VKALEGELAGVKGERDTQAQEKGEAQKAVEDLKQQVSAKAAELEQERKERAAGAEFVKALEVELAQAQAERDERTKENRQVQHQVAELTQQLEMKGSELQKVMDERSAHAKDQEQALQQVSEMKQQLSKSYSDIKDARQEAEDALDQLHLVQEEVERLSFDGEVKKRQLNIIQERLKESEKQRDHYIKLSSDQYKLISTSDQLDERMRKIIVSLIS